MKKYIIRTLSTIILCSLSAISASAKTYHVEHNNLLSWSANYDVNTLGNNIKRVSNIKVNGGPTGSITHKYITYDASNKVTLHFTRRVATLITHPTLSAKLKITNCA